MSDVNAGLLKILEDYINERGAWYDNPDSPDAIDGLSIAERGIWKRARTAIANARAAGDGWRPIVEYIERDGYFPVLICAPGKERCVAFIDATNKWWPIPANKPLDYKPTHFRELPSATAQHGDAI